jgi:Xaa-Pro aminopeptidase
MVIMPRSDVDLLVDLPNRVQRNKTRIYGNFFFSENKFLDEAEKEILTIVKRSTEKHPLKLLLQTLKEEKIDRGKIAIDERNLTPSMFSFFKKSLPRAEILEGHALFQEIRMVKTGEEIVRLKKAFEITEKAIFESLERAKEGISESELARKFERIIFDSGGMPLFTVIGFGRRSALPNVQPSSRKLKKGEVIRYDVGCRYSLYCSDVSRIACLGEPSKKYQEYYEAVLRGLEKALDEVRSGVEVSHIFDVAVETVRRSGIPEFKRHHVGHGIGIEVYDLPSITEGNKVLLEENMVLCLETPYYQLGFAGVQVEDAIVVKKKGYELLTKSSREIQKIG